MKQGDIFLVDLGAPSRSAPCYRHPHVVIQNNIFNQSRINTVVVCVITSNLDRADAPGNVLLDAGEANLAKACVVNVSQMITLDKRDLGQKIGTLSPDRVTEIIAGVHLVIDPRELDEWLG